MLILKRPRDSQPQEAVALSPEGVGRGLVGAWGLRGDATLVNLAGGSLGSLTATGATVVASARGMVYELSGSGQYLTNTANTVATDLPLSFFAWIWIDTAKAARIFDVSTGVTSNDVIGLQLTNTTICAQHYDGSGESIASVSNSSYTGRWVSIAGVFGSLISRKLYLDGALVASDTTTRVAPSGIDRVTIGYAPWAGSEYFDGRVASPLLFKRELSARDVQDLHENTFKAVLEPRRSPIPTAAGGPATHAATGALAAAGAAIAGSAARIAGAVTHAATGALATAGAAIAGASARTRAHPATGALATAGAVIAGAAARSGSATTHAATGSLAAAGAALVGAAAHVAIHSATGALATAGASIAGSAARAGAVVTHAATGALVGDGATMTGTDAASAFIKYFDVLSGRLLILRAL